MPDTLWFVLITLILAKPVVDDTGLEPDAPRIPGDVIMSKLLGGAISEERCNEGGKVSARMFESAGEGSVKVVYSCLEMPSEVGDYQGFAPPPE